DGGVQIAVLLGQVAPEGEGDVDRPGGDADEVRPDQRHRALAGEAGPDAGLELRVVRLELRRSHHDTSHDPGPRIGVQARASPPSSTGPIRNPIVGAGPVAGTGQGPPAYRSPRPWRYAAMAPRDPCARGWQASPTVRVP